MATTVMDQPQQTSAGFLIRWGVVTALLGALVSILAAHGFIFFVLTASIGLITSIGQWWLLRGRMQGAWQWVLVSTFGWLIGYVAAGAVAGLLLFNPIELNVFVTQAALVIVYALLFGVWGAFQSIVLNRKGYEGLAWTVISGAGGALLGILMQLTCGLGGADLFLTRILSAVDAAPPVSICVEIGATIPRLQSSEPLFNVLPLSFLAHGLGWAGYGIVTALGWRALPQRVTANTQK